MSLSRHLPTADKSVREGKWERTKLTGSEVARKTLGIVGFGTIGRLVSQRAAGLKMHVIAFDPFVAPEIYADLGVESVTLDELISRSDYVTLHCPLIEKTKNIINAAQLEKMKSTAMLINCARGGLIDEAALYEALKNKQIAGAALDVYENEPPTNSPLFELENIVFTPHLGASTNEAQLAVSVEIAQQAVTFLRSGEAVNALNLPRVSAEELKKSNDYMNLATQLGKVLAGLSLQPLTKLEVSLFGKAADVSPRPVSVAALIGVLSGQVSTPVNRVNAENIAKRQGLALVESVSQETLDYVSLIKLTGYSADSSTTVSGVLLGGRLPRLVSINDMDIEVVPEGTLLVTRHEDKPGVISAISSVLGNAAINISRMQVGVADTNSHAMAVISVSEPLNADLLAQIGAIPAVNQATQITL
jgi:D-3-phosphoglycerate dehydrogenase